MRRSFSIGIRLAAAVIALLLIPEVRVWAQGVIPGVNFHRMVDGFVTYLSRAYIMDPDLGTYRISANREGFVAGGTLRWDYNTTRMNLSDGYCLQFDATGSLCDGGANIIEQRNGTNGQTYRWFNTDNGANDEWAALTWSANTAWVRTQQSGTGVQRELTLDGSVLNLGSGGTIRWYVNGSLLANGAYDIGDGIGNSPVNIHAEGLIKSYSPTAGIGYGTGAGGTVTQITSRTTGVTINTVSGQITLVSAAGSATYASFTVTNSAVAATDEPYVWQVSGTDIYEIHVTAVAAGSFRVTFRTTGGTTTESPVFGFVMRKAVTS